MLLRGGLVSLAMLGLGFLGCGSRGPSSAIVLPPDGRAGVVLDDHLPDGFHITHVVAVVDGETVYDGRPEAPRAFLFQQRVTEGDHTLQLVVNVDVPCGLTLTTPSERLTAKIARSFQVGPNGGLVHVDAFAQSAWLHPAERVHLLVSLRGLREGRWLYGRSDEAKQVCGRLGRVERSRCVVRRLVERSRAQHDVAGLLCQKDKLEAIDDVIAELDRRDGSRGAVDSSKSTDVKTPDSRPVTVEARVGELEREAEYCVEEDLSWREQQVTTDRSACASYDDPPSY